MMLGLNETATLYKAIGRQSGVPVYAQTGTQFRCRTEPEVVHTASGKSVERTADARIFVSTLDAGTGDKIVTGEGRKYIVSEVQTMRGLKGVHHIEILARGEE